MGGVNSVAFSPDGRRVIPGGNDTSRRFGNSTNASRIAAFFARPGGDRLAMTAAGFFTGCTRGEQLLGIVRGLELTDIDQLHQSLFNPDLVREALAGDPDGEVREAAKVINLEKVVDSGPAPVLRSCRLPRTASRPATSRRSGPHRRPRQGHRPHRMARQRHHGRGCRQAAGQRTGLHRHPATGARPRRQHHRGRRLQRQQPAGLAAGAHDHQVRRCRRTRRSRSCISWPSASTPTSIRDGRRRDRFPSRLRRSASR